MQQLADEKYAEAFAHEIVEALATVPQPAGVRVEVYRDAEADTPAVRVRVGRVRYALTMPAPGAYFGLFRNRAWVGGVHHRLGEATPLDVAVSLVARIESTLTR